MERSGPAKKNSPRRKGVEESTAGATVIANWIIPLMKYLLFAVTQSPAGFFWRAVTRRKKIDFARATARTVREDRNHCKAAIAVTNGARQSNREARRPVREGILL